MKVTVQEESSQIKSERDEISISISLQEKEKDRVLIFLTLSKRPLRYRGRDVSRTVTSPAPEAGKHRPAPGVHTLTQDLLPLQCVNINSIV